MNDKLHKSFIEIMSRFIIISHTSSGKTTIADILNVFKIRIKQFGSVSKTKAHIGYARKKKRMQFQTFPDVTALSGIMTRRFFVYESKFPLMFANKVAILHAMNRAHFFIVQKYYSILNLNELFKTQIIKSQ